MLGIFFVSAYPECLQGSGGDERANWCSDVITNVLGTHHISLKDEYNGEWDLSNEELGNTNKQCRNNLVSSRSCADSLISFDEQYDLGNLEWDLNGRVVDVNFRILPDNKLTRHICRRRIVFSP